MTDYASMMEYGEKVTADPSTFDDPQYMFLRERLRALQDGWAEVHQMWENRQSLLSQSLSLQMFNRCLYNHLLMFCSISCVKQCCGSGSISQRFGSGSFSLQAKIVRKTLIPTVL